MRLVGVALFFCTTLAAQAATLEDSLAWLAPEDRTALLNDGSVKVFSDRFDHLNLWRGGPFEASAKTLFTGRESTLAAEALFIVPVPLPSEPEARERLLEKAMTSVSTMKGLQVYSISLKRMETFIFDAYRTSSTDKKAKLSDPEVPLAQGATSFIMFQNEEQTGESFARYSFSKEPGWYQVTLTNLTSLNYGFVPLVAPQDLLTRVYVIPYENRLLIYGATVAKTFSLFGWERSRTASLYTRMEALVTWLSNNLKAAP